MILVCSWCKKEIGTKEPYDDLRISHSLCEPCYYQQQIDIAKYKMELEEEDEISKNVQSE